MAEKLKKMRDNYIGVLCKVICAIEIARDTNLRWRK